MASPGAGDFSRTLSGRPRHRAAGLFRLLDRTGRSFVDGVSSVPSGLLFATVLE
jgi:hypothetical protein